jgi:hypothetical protein
MKNQSTIKKPQYLSLDPVAKKEVIAEINDCDLPHKEIFKECTLFTEDLERLLKDPKVNLKAIKRLFELRAEALKKIHLAL